MIAVAAPPAFTRAKWGRRKSVANTASVASSGAARTTGGTARSTLPSCRSSKAGVGNTGGRASAGTSCTAESSSNCFSGVMSRGSRPACGGRSKGTVV